MRIIPIIVLLACVAWEASARPQEDEPRAAPNRGLLKRGLPGKGKATSTTTPAPAEVEGDYEEEGDYPVETDAQEASTEAPVSSTEGKKLVSGGVRPFRSNTDFLEALKRRRAQAAEAKQQGNSGSVASQQTDNQSETPQKSSYSKKRFNTPRESNSEDSPAPSKPTRGRFSKAASKSFQEPENEEQNDAPPARSGRPFSRRGGQ